MVIWERRELVVEESGSFKVWRRVGGDGPQSWVGEFMGVVCGEVFAWAERILVKNV